MLVGPGDYSNQYLEISGDMSHVYEHNRHQDLMCRHNEH